jgi:hypothetical protein
MGGFLGVENDGCQNSGNSAPPCSDDANSRCISRQWLWLLLLLIMLLLLVLLGDPLVYFITGLLPGITALFSITAGCP